MCGIKKLRKGIQKGVLLLLLLVLSGCTRRMAVTESSEPGQEKSEVSSSAGVTEPASPAISREDPRARGYYLDEGLTNELRAFFAGVNTNNTDEKSAYRSLTASHKRRLDLLAAAWAEGKLTEEEAKTRMEQTGFFWPDDPYQQQHFLKKSHFRLYEREEGAASELYESIRLDNIAARHYLFLEVFRDTVTGWLRIYMVNGMIW